MSSPVGSVKAPWSSMPTCKSCGAEITFVATVKGHRMPLDPQPVVNGNVVIREGKAVVLNPAETAAAMRDGSEILFHSHFATCIDQARHRRGRTAQPR